ncbi:MAG: methionine adenosyltransferase [candidate division Zixibacteria bacterium]|nr:methionine adenosyltransferase [candidate division Zixibacteria bacterium]
MFRNSNFVFSSESVTEGHPDKVCDQISDAVLDELLRQDSKSRVACEAFVTVGLVIVGGEITTTGYADIARLVREIVRDIGYTDPKFGFNHETCAVLNAIGEQAADIAQGVDIGGAGDQGIMFGYATDETPELMPLPITLAHKLTRNLANVRKKKDIEWLGPDGKSQVTVVYDNGKASRVDAVVLSTQHTEAILDGTRKKITEESKQLLVEKVIKPVIPDGLLHEGTEYHINPTGIFLIGGPQSDTGMTGRKIIVDTYGGWAPHGGGAFSGKDPTKVDRSASYMARYIAKNIVAAGLAKRCTIQLAYAIGVVQPVSIAIDTEGTGEIEDTRLEELVRKHFDLSPRGIINNLDLLRPIYKNSAAYGHFGRSEPEFTWERTDRVNDLKSWS